MREVGRLFIGDNIHSDRQAAQAEIDAPLTDVEPSATPVPLDAPLVVHNPVSTLQTTSNTPLEPKEPKTATIPEKQHRRILTLSFKVFSY